MKKKQEPANKKKFLESKFSKLKKEGYSEKQLIAIALDIARKKGYDA